jgi:hypothetical protein
VNVKRKRRSFFPILGIYELKVIITWIDLFN